MSERVCESCGEKFVVVGEWCEMCGIEKKREEVEEKKKESVWCVRCGVWVRESMRRELENGIIERSVVCGGCGFLIMRFEGVGGKSVSVVWCE